MSQNTFHVGIYVQDLPAAVEQYKKILGLEPAKVKADYAKFELADPPVILALNLGGEPGTVHHLGIRYPETDRVATELKRTKMEGVTVLEQQGTTCCYAKSDKFWVRDADGMPWEMYTLLGDADVLTDADPAIGALFSKEPTVDARAGAESCCAPTCCAESTDSKESVVDAQADAESCCAPTCCAESPKQEDKAVIAPSSVPQVQEQACCGPTATAETLLQPQLGSRASGGCGSAISVRADIQPARTAKSSCC